MTRGGVVGLFIVLLAVAFGVAGFRNGLSRPAAEAAAASVPGAKPAGGGGAATSQPTPPNGPDDSLGI